MTNQLQYARDAGAVVFLEGGRVAARGTYAELLPCEGFANLLKEYEARARPAPPPGAARARVLRTCCWGSGRVASPTRRRARACVPGPCALWRPA